MSKEELRRLIAEREQEFERNKLKRLIFTILAIAAIIFYFFCKENTSLSVLTVLGNAGASIFLAGVYFYVNMLVFGFLCNKGEEESKTLESLKKQLEEME